MMERMWSDILNRFGQPVTLRRRESAVTVRAIVQPVVNRRERQEVPGPLGLGRQDLFRYFGPAGHRLDLDTVVEWKGQTFRVQSAHLTGEGVCPFWGAVLCPGEEEAA